jgi:uncharacterized protein YprB with RNaseH-like and TPR domain
MRDLGSRLRSIIRQNPGTRPEDRPARPLTYVPEQAASRNTEQAAVELGGVVVRSANGACVAIDHVWDGQDWHGRRRVSSFRLEADAPLALFDARLESHADWARRVVFFDVETTGLSGGAGTLAFLVGCGWFEDDGFRVRQFFLAGPSGERVLLDALATEFSDTTLLVTYNGKSFDVPLMETRWAFHRESPATDDLAHFDMLPTARRLWGRLRSAARVAGRDRARVFDRDPDEPHRDSCSLSALERSVLGFHRLGDVPGLEIPTRYFHFLRTGDASVVEGVLEHNRHDLLSLAAVMSHALALAQDGPEACREAGEQVGLGRMYERAGQLDRATRAFELAAACGDREVRSHALARLAVLLRREARFEEAAEAWRGVLDLLGRGHDAASPLARRAAEALAIHHEHRARDLSKARRYAESLKLDARGRFRQDVEHRLGRLDRKLKGPGRPDPKLDWD